MPGVIAFGTVVEPCRPKGDENKVGVYIHEVRLTPKDGMLSRYDLKFDPILAKMQVITVGTGSNFRLSEEEARRLRYLWVNTNEESDEEVYGDYKSTEGRIKLAIHKIRERDPNLVRHAKQLFLQRHGALYCEICGFSFDSTYGSLGQGFIEVHHIKPLSNLEEGVTTATSDLIMVCANCHRILHQGNAEENLHALRAIFNSKRSSST